LGLLILFIILAVIITIHEFGHLIVAKFFKIRVNIYSIGFGQRIIGIKFYKGKCSIKVLNFKSTNEEIWNRNDNTEYRISPILFGGFCAIEGETDSSGKDYELDSKPFFQKFCVAFAGIGLNILSGIICLLYISIKNFGFKIGLIRGFNFCLISVLSVWQGIIDMINGNFTMTKATEVNSIMSNISLEYILIYFGLFSIIMALFNALPIPALDGSLPILWILKKFFKNNFHKILNFIWFSGFIFLMLLQLIILYFWIF